ncbi:MAG: hypothetical protein L3J23_02860 [Flavobacteriaceae bacterium]|nr:hypothetical protein [Flavobacteriaceae bacterium]
MIIIDLINDEAPLFIGAIENLINEDKLKSSSIIGIVEGNRWEKEAKRLNTQNRLVFFDELDKKNIDIKSELERIANEYDNTNIYACDRYLINKKREFQEKMLVYTYLFFENLFYKNITHYFTTGIAYTYNLVSYQVSKKFNIKHVSFYGIRFKNKTAISYDILNNFNEINEAYKKFSLQKVTKEMYEPINAFVNKPVQPSYMNNTINGSTINLVFIKEFFIRFKKYFFVKRHKYDLFTNNPFKLSGFKLKKVFNAKKINLFHNFIFDKVNLTEKYFLFPLHMQPEASTLILASNYVEQKTAIINISKLIPPNVKLYIKEHRSALGQNRISFYRELKKYPNIKLVSFKENTFNLIKHSLGTINLSSTVGLETLFLKKPSLVLGNVFYNRSNLTLKVNDFNQLKKYINDIVFNKFNLDEYFENYDARLAYFIYCLNENSYSFEFNVAKLDTKKRVMKKNNIKEFSNCIYKIILDDYNSKP